MKIFSLIKSFLDRYFFYDKWTCNLCNKEIFDDKYFCSDCEKSLPKNEGCICYHCGRKTEVDEKYCLTCKSLLSKVDIARSSFVYDKPISYLIQRYKYNGKKYLANLFIEYLYQTAIKYGFNADYVVYVPMTEKAIKKRGFNHGELLARGLAEKLNIEVTDCIEKNKDTVRQAKLNREERLKNLKGVFRLKYKKHLKDKTVLIVDDVLTTGATSQTIASLLKGAGVRKILLLTVASVPSKKLI